MDRPTRLSESLNINLREVFEAYSKEFRIPLSEMDDYDRSMAIDWYTDRWTRAIDNSRVQPNKKRRRNDDEWD
jgi:hypothetical protein